MATPIYPLPAIFSEYSKEELIEKIDSLRISKRLAMQSINRKAEQIKTLQEQYDKEHEGFTALQTKYEALEADHTKLKQTRNQLMQRYTHYKGLYIETEEKYNQLVAKHKALEQRHRDLIESNNELNHQHSVLEREFKSLQQQHDSHKHSPESSDALPKNQQTEEIERIRTHYDQQFRELKKEKIEAVDSLRRQLRAQHTKIMNQIRQIKDISHKLNEEEYKTQTAQAENDNLSVLLISKQDIIQELKQSIEMLKMKNARPDETPCQPSASPVASGSNTKSTIVKMSPAATETSLTTTKASPVATKTSTPENAAIANDAVQSAASTANSSTAQTSTPVFTNKKRQLDDKEDQNPRPQKKAVPLACISNARHKNGRAHLEGQACTCCTGFYAGDPVLTVNVGGNMVEVTPEQRIQHHSRHRTEKKTKPSTPPGFWDLEFGSPPDPRSHR